MCIPLIVLWACMLSWFIGWLITLIVEHFICSKPGPRVKLCWKNGAKHWMVYPTKVVFGCFTLILIAFFLLICVYSMWAFVYIPRSSKIMNDFSTFMSDTSDRLSGMEDSMHLFSYFFLLIVFVLFFNSLHIYI